MTRAIRWHLEAERDLYRLEDFLAEKSPAAAVRAASTLAKAVRSLMRHPERGRMHPENGMRELIVPFGSGAYVVRYRVEPGEVFIVRIFHALEDR